MKNVLVFYLYSNNNAGDMAICVGAIDMLRKANMNVTLVSRFAESDLEYRESVHYIQKYYPDIKVEPGIFSLDRSASALRKLGSYAYGIFRRVLPVKDKRLTELVEDSDIVLFNGGNLLRCANATDAARLSALFYPIEIAHTLGKKIICLPQSTAKSSPWGLRYLEKKLQLFDEIYIREGESFAHMKSLFPLMGFKRSIDLAFFIDKRGVLDKTLRSAYAGRVAIVMRGTGIGDIGSLDDSRVNEMADGLETFIRSHSDEKYLFVVQTKKDRSIVDAFLQRLTDIDADEIELHDPIELLDLYSVCKSLVTMRLHAGILAIRAGIPVMGYFDSAWGLKNKGLMSDFNMGYTEKPEHLTAKYDALMSRYHNLDPSSLIARREEEIIAQLKNE